ncbi:Uncharacterised protein [Vibrio cholerae]|nr:Uncharacterised protein [Vibrio cholerae]
MNRGANDRSECFYHHRPSHKLRISVTICVDAD